MEHTDALSGKATSAILSKLSDRGLSRDHLASARENQSTINKVNRSSIPSGGGMGSERKSVRLDTWLVGHDVLPAGVRWCTRPVRRSSHGHGTDRSALSVWVPRDGERRDGNDVGGQPRFPGARKWLAPSAEKRSTVVRRRVGRKSSMPRQGAKKSGVPPRIPRVPSRLAGR